MNEKLFNGWNMLLTSAMWTTILFLVASMAGEVNRDLAKQVETYKAKYNEQRVMVKILKENCEVR